METNFTVAFFEYGSKEQIQSIALRYEVLRKPLGLTFGVDELESEQNQLHLLALEGALVVGCMLLLPGMESKVKMRQVAVLPNKQGNNIGKKMVAFCENYCIKNGIKTIVLHARENAVPFYLKLGYTNVGEMFEEVGIPHFKMEKTMVFT